MAHRDPLSALVRRKCFATNDAEMLIQILEYIARLHSTNVFLRRPARPLAEESAMRISRLPPLRSRP